MLYPIRKHRVGYYKDHLRPPPPAAAHEPGGSTPKQLGKPLQGTVATHAHGAFNLCRTGS